MEWFLQSFWGQIGVFFAGGLITLLTGVLTKNVSIRKSGIKKIYTEGKSIKSMERKMRNSKTIRVLAVTAHHFLHGYRELLTEHIINGGDVDILLSSPLSEYIEDVSRIENRGDDAVKISLKQAVGIIDAIQRDADLEAAKTNRRAGKICLRFYRSEMRNSMIICVDNSNNESAWMSIVMPPRVASQCKMIEYSDAGDCIHTFNAIWNLYANDTKNLEIKSALLAEASTGSVVGTER